ncbi:MAG: hypothetical protein H7318_13775 [Oligoflexus sp.]|nr:hypothetical protein [Oligoflexus sp.]
MQKTVGRNRALESSLSEILKVQKSKGKHYSKAHRELVMKAFSAGMSLGDIHKLTMIPILTLRAWRKKSLGENFAEFSLAPEMKPTSRSPAAIIINDMTRIELDLQDLTSELIVLLRQAV